ncbi:pectate lyase [Cellvibrio sp. NN19]|uniref:pectate lyase n=1 Tax=Cellvibrio chitinivorans TaxID=3102792 RepID=UPI002B400C98|nr:pectate lyase [Cellvibrio sp. NN19]
MLKKLFITTALLGCATSAFSASNRPDGYVTICKIGETCSVSGSTNVAFGAADKFVYKILSGSFSCSVATFGSDPNPAKSVKECSIPSSGSGNSGGGSSSSSGSNNGSVNVSASAGNGSASLSWSSISNANSIEIYIDTDSNPTGRVRIASLSGSATSYSATNLTNGTTYYFWVKYRLADGNWYNSNVGSATPSGSSSGGGGNSGSITGATCGSGGSTVNVSSTIVVSSGTYDGGCKVFNATSALGDGSQSESQKPVFRVENGATLKNVVLGNNAADGIHFYNGGTIDNIRWTNVGEDAMTIKSSGTVNVRNISGYAGSDKFIQVNAASTLNVSNCIVDDMGKFLRQNGGTTFKITVNVDRCQISNMGEGIFRTDSSTSVAKITNSRLHDAGSICIGKWASCTSSGITNY